MSGSRRSGIERAFVLAVYALCLSAALGYTLRFASWVPWWDYWDLAEVIGGARAFDPGWLLEPHQEHRIPLSKALLVVLAWLVPDVRAASLLAVLGCAVFAGIAVASAGRIRGRIAAPDVVLPMLALHAGHYTTYLLGFQLQMVMSSLLALTAFHALLVPTPRRRLVGAVAIAVLPLCGINGVVAAVPLLAWLAWAGWDVGAGRGGSGRVATVALVLTGIAALAVAVAGVDVVLRMGGRELDAAAALRTTAQFVATGLGAPAGRHALPVVLVFAAVVAVCAPAFARALRAGGAARNEALGILALLSGGLVLAAVIGSGRSDHGARAGVQHRYVVMSLLIAYALYLATVLAARGGGAARWLERAWPVAVAVAVAAATADGVRLGRHYEKTLARAEATLGVLPADVLGSELQTVLHGGSAAVLARRIALLRGAGLLPEPSLPPADALARYRFDLARRLIAAGRLDEAERQIAGLEASGYGREAALLRERARDASGQPPGARTGDERERSDPGAAGD